MYMGIATAELKTTVANGEVNLMIVAFPVYLNIHWETEKKKTN